MSSLTGIPQGSLLIGATLAFAGVAWNAALVSQPAECPATTEIIKYFPAPEVRVVMPPVPLNWPVEERHRADDTPAAEPAVAKDDSAEDQPRRRYRKHHHHWRR